MQDIKTMTDEELKNWIKALECQQEVVERLWDEAQEERISRGAKKYAERFASLFNEDFEKAGVSKTDERYNLMDKLLRDCITDKLTILK